MPDMSDEERANIEGAPARLRLARALAESFEAEDLDALAEACSHYRSVLQSVAKPGKMSGRDWRRFRALGAFADIHVWSAGYIQQGGTVDEIEAIEVGIAHGVLDESERPS